jgi:cytochrome c oxidase subunit 4
MSAAAPTAHEETVHGAGRAHPTDRNYVVIALILAVITAGEVAMSYADVSNSIFIPVLMVMMVAKFFIVVAWFMHLRFDSRLFRRLFLAGLVLAAFVYLAFLTSMQFFGDDTVSNHPALAPPAATSIS